MLGLSHCSLLSDACCFFHDRCLRKQLKESWKLLLVFAFSVTFFILCLHFYKLLLPYLNKYMPCYAVRQGGVVVIFGGTNWQYKLVKIVSSYLKTFWLHDVGWRKWLQKLGFKIMEGYWPFKGAMYLSNPQIGCLHVKNLKHNQNSGTKL